MEPELLQAFLIGLGSLIAALITAVAGVSIGVWKWDARRIHAEAAKALHASEERAKEREHELRLARIQAEKEKAQAEQSAERTVTALQQQVIDLRKTIEERLFLALDQQHGTNRDLTGTIQAHISAVEAANTTQLAAIRALSGDVEALGRDFKTRLTGEYQAILGQVGAMLDQTTAVGHSVEALVSRLAQHHESVMLALEGRDKTVARDGEHHTLIIPAPDGARTESLSDSDKGVREHDPEQ